MEMINITILNFVYAVIGAMVTLCFMILGYRIFDRMTPFNTHDQLEKGNVAVGIVVGAIFISLGIAVGIVVGMGLN